MLKTQTNLLTKSKKGEKMLFENNRYDQKVYDEELRDFLPDKIIDIHTHVWKDENRVKVGTDAIRSVTWTDLVAKDNPIEDLQETYRIMFPDKKVKALIFGTMSQDALSLKLGNDYVKESAEKAGYDALYYSTPRESAEEIEKNIKEDGFLGLKSYLDLSDPIIPSDEIRVYDFFPPHQLEVVNDLGGIIMLHLPRSKRFADPCNLFDIKNISERYKNLKLIVAHIGRAYTPKDMRGVAEYLKGSKNFMVDFSANTCEYAMEEALKTFGAERLMFGSDLPILRMRMRRIEENGTYISLVPPKMYGDLTNEPHMREVSEEETKTLTYFMYEEIRAMKQAVTKLGLGKNSVENMFYNNAANLLETVKGNVYGKQVSHDGKRKTF